MLRDRGVTKRCRATALHTSGLQVGMVQEQEASSRRKTLRVRAVPRRSSVVEKYDAQLDVRAVELGGQVLKRRGGSNSQHRGLVQFYLPGGMFQCWLGNRDCSVLLNASGDNHDSLLSLERRFRHDRVPIALYPGGEPGDVLLEIHAFGRSDEHDPRLQLGERRVLRLGSGGMRPCECSGGEKYEECGDEASRPGVLLHGSQRPEKVCACGLQSSSGPSRRGGLRGANTVGARHGVPLRARRVLWRSSLPAAAGSGQLTAHRCCGTAL
jgi:hypothetical protein